MERSKIKKERVENVFSCVLGGVHIFNKVCLFIKNAYLSEIDGYPRESKERTCQLLTDFWIW